MNGRERQLKKEREWSHITRGFQGQVKDFAIPHVLDLRRQLEHLWGFLRPRANQSTQCPLCNRQFLLSTSLQSNFHLKCVRVLPGLHRQGRMF